MKKPSKMMSLFLALLMALSTLAPSLVTLTDVWASEEKSTVIIAGSDFQDPDDKSDTFAPASSANVAAILNAIKKDYPAANGLIFCGDYDKDLPSSNVENSISALKATFTAAYGDNVDTFFVQGNHDQVTQGTKGLTGPGAHDTNDYGVYIIDEDDYQWKSGSSNEATIKTTASNLKKYLDDKANANYDKPIFVASHVPLHYSVRTQEGDAKYGKYIFDVLNEAGKAGLTIIFLYGHDNCKGWDN